MLTFTCKVTHLHKCILQTLQRTASEWQLQKGFHKERACLALPTSTRASTPSHVLAPALMQAVVSRSSISWKLNQYFRKATCSSCLHKCCWQWERMGGGGPGSGWLDNGRISFSVAVGSKQKAKPYQSYCSSLQISGVCYSSPSLQPLCSHHFPRVNYHAL